MPEDTLIDFILAEIRLGKDRNTITTLLLQNDWTQEEIDEAFLAIQTNPNAYPQGQVINTQSPQPQPVEAPFQAPEISEEETQPSSKKKLFVIIAVVIGVLLALIAGIVFWYSNRSGNLEYTGGEVTKKHISDSFLKSQTQKLLEETDVEFEDRSEVSGSGCSANLTYKGSIKGGDKYAREITETNNTAIECGKLGLQSSYFETYWVGQDVYIKKNEAGRFNKTSGTESKDIAANPTIRMNNIIGGIKSIKVLEINEGENVFEVRGEVKPENEAEGSTGEITIFINTADGSIKQLKYDLNRKLSGADYNTKGEALFTSPAAEIKVPDFGPMGVSVTDMLNNITSWLNVEYTVNTEDYFIKNTEGGFSDPKLQVIIGEESFAKSYDCSLDEVNCQNSLEQYKSAFSGLPNMIQDAQPSTCSLFPPGSGARSEMYKDSLYINISNIGRSADDTGSYSFDVSFYIRGNDKNTYKIKIKVGEDKCFEGTADAKKLETMYKSLNDFAYGYL